MKKKIIGFVDTLFVENIFDVQFIASEKNQKKYTIAFDKDLTLIVKCRGDLVVRNGIRELLEQLGNDYRLVVWTYDSTLGVKSDLRRYDLLRFFEKVISYDSYSREHFTQSPFFTCDDDYSIFIRKPVHFLGYDFLVDDVDFSDQAIEGGFGFYRIESEKTFFENDEEYAQDDTCKKIEHSILKYFMELYLKDRR
ncbi:DUF705 domain-containing protein [Candidatus Margulisiibacteriota bacterium]